MLDASPPLFVSAMRRSCSCATPCPVIVSLYLIAMRAGVLRLVARMLRGA
jgi:hypothetical protein